MIPRIDTRMYTNLILTAIALLLFAGAAREFGVGFTGSAQAQVQSRTRNVPDLDRTDTGVTIDSTIPQTQDVAVAQATSEVAASNLQIAAAIRELAVAVREGSGDIRSAIGNTGAAAAAQAATPAGATPVPSERPVIEVGP